MTCQTCQGMTCFKRHGLKRQDLERNVRECHVLTGMAGIDRTWTDMSKNEMFFTGMAGIDRTWTVMSKNEMF